MKLAILLPLLAATALGQTFTTTHISEVDCVASGCNSVLENGDTLIFSAWDLAGSFSYNGVSSTGSVYGTYNDGASLTCDANPNPNGNVAWIRLSVLDLLTPSNTTVVNKNCLISFKGGGAPQWPPAANGTCTVGVNNSCTWKSEGVGSVDGVQYLQVYRQETCCTYYGHDSTLIKSSDGGATWLNPAHLGGQSPAADGDAPAGPGDATYPASIIWPDPSPFDGTTQYAARLNFIMYCKDNTVGCSSVDNNATYVYALMYDGRFTSYRLARAVRATIANLVASSWSYYHCPGYSTSVCDGSNNANWDAALANATVIFSPGTNGILGGIVYSSELQSYIFTGGYGTCCVIAVSTAPHPWGPYTLSNTFVVDGYNFAAPIISTLTTITPGSKIRLAISGTGYTHNQPGSLFFNTVEITKSGVVSSGSVTNLSGKVSVRGRAAVGVAVTGSVLTLNNISQSNTQAILSYTAPSTAACSVVVSESPSYSPSVNDTSTILFTSADQDDRDGNLGAGTTSRMIVVGRRAADLALDSKYYSRALQTATVHYIRVNCGGSIGTTSFTTTNIPGGSTYPDLPSTVSNTGVWRLPTVPTDDRTATLVDQFTGALMKPITTWSDRAGSDPRGFTLGDGGFLRPCTAGLQTSPIDGIVFVCQFLISGNSATMFYAIRPSDGFVRKLGKANVNFGPPLKMNTDMTFVGGNPDSGYPRTKYAYNGDWDTHDDLPVDGGTLYSSVSSATQLTAFDATFDGTKFSCPDFWANKGDSQQFDCSRTGGIGQDGYGWKIIYWGGTNGAVYGNGSCGAAVFNGACPGIIAAFNPMTTQSVRFQTNHNAQPMVNVGTNPTVPIETINWQTFEGTAINSSPWRTTLAAGASMGATSISVTTCPTNSFGVDSFNPGCWAAGGGDSIHITGDPPSYLTTAASGTGPYTLTLASGLVNTYSSGTNVDLSGNATNFSGHNSSWRLTYWNYASDPTGTSLVRDNWIDPGGHYDNWLLGRVSETGDGWQVWFGDISTGLNTAPNFVGPDSPLFHGLIGYCFSSICNKHPSVQQTTTTPSGIERNLFTDGLTFNGGDEQFGANCSGHVCDNATTSGGNIYLYKGATMVPYNAQYAADKTVLWRKVRPSVVVTGSIPYKDVSGPGSTIATGAGGNWTYCVAYLAGECLGGSAAGNIYFNPGTTLTHLYCTGSDSPSPTASDICIAPMPSFGRALVPELYAGAANATEFTRRSRILSGGLNGIRAQTNFPFSKILPNASYYMIQSGGNNPISSSDTCNDIQNGFCNLWLLKKPPFPAADAYDRSDFISITTGTITGGGSVTNAIVKFGYLEFGLSTDFYCTSRAEACIANSATVPSGANPFSYPVDGSSNTLATLTGVSCTSTCTINIPALSGHTLYYQIITRNSSNAAVTTGPIQIITVP